MVYRGNARRRSRKQLYPNIDPIYMVGIDMALIIENKHGPQALREALDDPSAYKFFNMFNQAPSKTAYKYSSQTLKIIKQFQQRI